MTALEQHRRPPLAARPAVLALLTAALAGLLMLLGASSAAAHAELVETTPAEGEVLDEAPHEAVLRFNESVRLVDGAVRLFPPGEEPIVLKARVRDTDVVAALPDGLSDGGYALSYRIVSADGHPVSGALSFSVGSAGDPPTAERIELDAPRETEAAVSILTAVQYVALLLFSGLIWFEALVRPRDAVRTPARVGALPLASGSVATLASALLIPISALDVVGDPLSAVAAPAHWLPGVLWQSVASCLLVVAGVGAGLAALALGKGGRRGILIAALAALLAVCAPVCTGHSQTIEPHPLMLAADLGHLVAGAFWSGGLVGLVRYLAVGGPRSGRKGSGVVEAQDVPELAVAAVLRFSRLAFWSVVVLAVSGIVMGVLILGTIDRLVTTAYGLTLLLKLGVVLPVIGLAAYNRRRLIPAVLSQPTASRRWSALRRTTAWEAALLGVVLVITGFLVNLSPARDRTESAARTQVTPESTEVSGSAQQLDVVGSLAPGAVGRNELEFSLRYRGEEVDPVDVEIRATLPERDLGPLRVPAELDAESGRYTATLSLPASGEWELRFVARVSTFAEPIVDIPVEIR